MQRLMQLMQLTLGAYHIRVRVFLTHAARLQDACAGPVADTEGPSAEVQMAMEQLM
jgi:hypothetical protein